MAVTITVEDVRAFCPANQATDQYIQTMINVVAYKLDDCLDGCYPLPDGEDMQKAIKLNLVCHFSALQGQGIGQVTSRRAANGSSVSYEKYSDRDGLSMTAYGETVLMIDTCGCWQNMIQQTWFVDTIGGDNPPRWDGC